MTSVFEAGTVRMGAAIMAVIFGVLVGPAYEQDWCYRDDHQECELAAISPLVITLIMSIAEGPSLLHFWPLGSIIMVGSIVPPILISVGVPAASAACIF